MLDPARRAALNAAKLAALVSGQWGDRDYRPHPFVGGAALTGPDDDGTPAAWLFVDERPERSLGPALLWAERQGADRLHVIADAGTGVLARQATLSVPPAPEVWHIEGTTLRRADPDPVAPPAAVAAPPELVDLLLDAGLEVIVEAGIVRGEVNGLEVARIVSGTTTAGVPIEAQQLEVGVGKADRELTAMLHGELSPTAQLGRVVDIVRRHRRPDAPRHPLNQLVPDRWLRAVLCRRPDLVGLTALQPAQGPRPRPDLTARDIAVAGGRSNDGSTVVVVCSVGGALDLVPEAADARAAIDPDARLLLAVPERDDLPGNRRLAGRLRAPAEVVPIPGDWRSLTG